MPVRLAKAIDLLVALFGVLFCLQWTLAFLTFPIFKDMPLGFVPAAGGLALGGFFCLAPVRQWCNFRLDAFNATSFLISLCVLAFLLRCACIFVFPVEPQNDPSFYHRYALNMLKGNGYGEPGRIAFFPPGMSFVLAGWYWLTEPTPISGKFLNALVGTGTVVLIYAIGRRTINDRAAKWAALLAAIMPTLVFYSATLGYELILGFVFLTTVYLALLVRDTESSGLGLAAFLGLVLGFGSLIKPICLPLPVLLVVWWLLLGMGRRAFVYGAVIVAVMACVVGIWTLRNYHALGELVLVSTNGGVVLYSANNPYTEGTNSHVKPFPGEHDEVSRDRMRRKAAQDWIRAHPIDFLRLAVRKALYTWGTSTQIMSVISDDRMVLWQEQACMGIINVFWGALLVQCLAATRWTRIWRERRLYVAFALLGYVFIIHIISEAMSRHHIPVVGVLILIASAALARNSATKNQPGSETTVTASI